MNMKLDTKKVQLIMMKKLMNKCKLAKKAGLSNCAIYQILNHSKNPNYKTIGKIAAALGVEPSEIVKEEQEEE